ncbi:MAG TPA: SLATT domain-containing protein [Vicinamibacterales bacterium]|jgi:hypothetical protein
MFSLTVIDHVRLDSEHVAQNYTIHARAADRLAGLAFGFRIAMAVLLAFATGACVINLLVAGRAYQILAVVATSLALVGFTLYAVFGIESRVTAHRAFAHRLWLLSERYRSLIAEADGGLLETAALLQRRDALIEALHNVYERGFDVDQSGFESARLPAVKSERAA